MRCAWLLIRQGHVRIYLAALSLLIAAHTEAATITGAFSMAGGLAPGIDFSMPGTAEVNSQTMIVMPGTIVGDFTPYLSPFQTGTHQDLPYDPFAPVADMWTITGSLLPGIFSFDLQTLIIDFQSSSQLDLSGTGLISHPDFDDTSFEWVATFQSLSLTASFSASLQAVPEPSAGLLLATGLLGLGMHRRTRASRR